MFMHPVPQTPMQQPQQMTAGSIQHSGQDATLNHIHSKSRKSTVKACSFSICSNITHLCLMLAACNSVARDLVFCNTLNRGVRPQFRSRCSLSRCWLSRCRPHRLLHARRRAISICGLSSSAKSITLSEWGAKLWHRECREMRSVSAISGSPR